LIRDRQNIFFQFFSPTYPRLVGELIPYYHGLPQDYHTLYDVSIYVSMYLCVKKTMRAHAARAY